MRPHTFGFGPPGEHPSIVAVMLTTSFSMRTTAGNASPCSGFDALAEVAGDAAAAPAAETEVRSIHWFPYDRVGVVNADP